MTEISTESSPCDPSQAPVVVAPVEEPTHPRQALGERRATASPVLEKLFELYPHLFGQRFVPLKTGIYQDLLQAHPDVFERAALKVALAVHTRSTRYLGSVASGMRRHDLSGRAVQALEPEHVFLACVELFRRRQPREPEQSLAKLQKQLTHAYRSSGLSRQDYLARLPSVPDPVAQVLEEALDQVEQQRAREAALLKAYRASGQTPIDFAAALGIEVREIAAALQGGG